MLWAIETWASEARGDGEDGKEGGTMKPNPIGDVKGGRKEGVDGWRWQR
jgi:hypothetical protein